MPPKFDRSTWIQRRVDGWNAASGRWVNGLLLFLTLTGLAVFALPFSAFNQHAVVVHTAVGLVFLAPFVWYLARHVAAYWAYPLTSVKFTGYAAGLMGVVCSLSGVILTWEGAFGTRITYLWRTVHIVTTFGLILFLVPHLASVLRRERKAAHAATTPAIAAGIRGWWRLSFASLGGCLLLTAGMTAAVRPVAFANEFPDDYDAAYGNADAGPFAPSLATTETGGAFDPRSLGDSASCGTSGCHEEIYEEWLPSAHRYASMDAGFQAIQGVMAEQNGPASTRYCGGCHDPISLFSGTKNIGVEDLTGLSGYQEGISCLACHAIAQTDVKGNANYVMTQPERYVYELREGPVAGFLADFLIRTYPKQHVETLSRRMFKTPEFCAACHKQFIDEEVNQVGWVQLQNQYDNWKASRWHDADDPQRTIECRECHMPLHDSTDPAAGDLADFNRSGDDGKHRSHAFLGANQFVPLLHDLPGAEEHCARTEAWLKGEIEIPEIADRWTEGPAVPIELIVPTTAEPGERVDLRVRVINNKAGHDFPTGPLDIIQAWVEIDVTDDAGNVVFSSGKLDERRFVETGTFMFKAEPVDRYGNLIDRHNLWEMVGVRFKRSLFPGSEEVASYAFDCSGINPEQGEKPELVEDAALTIPGDVTGSLHVEARLNYRKFDQYLLDFAFGEDSGLTAPVTVLSTASATIPVVRQ